MSEVDCEAQDKYLKAVEESAKKAHADDEWGKAYIIRERGWVNTRETRDDCK